MYDTSVVKLEFCTEGKDKIWQIVVLIVFWQNKIWQIAWILCALCMIINLQSVY